LLLECRVASYGLAAPWKVGLLAVLLSFWSVGLNQYLLLNPQLNLFSLEHLISKGPGYCCEGHYTLPHLPLLFSFPLSERCPAKPIGQPDAVTNHPSSRLRIIILPLLLLPTPLPVNTVESR